MPRLKKRTIVTSDDSGQGFGDRLREALAGRPVAWLAREAGLPDPTIRNYLGGAQPPLAAALKIANALSVDLLWLAGGLVGTDVRGAGRAGAALFDASDADWVFLPVYKFESEFDTFTPRIPETIPVRRDWLNKSLGVTTGLWLTEMPSGDLPTIAAEGETIVCRNAFRLEEQKPYIFGRHGRLLVRRYLDECLYSDVVGGDPLEIDETIIPIGQVLGRFGISKV